MKPATDTLKALNAGAQYFFIVFAIGFVLGTVRVLLVIPRVGELVGVLIELPILLTLAWIICARVIAKTHVPRRIGPRLVVGASAFLLLIAAEFTLSVILFGDAIEDHFAAFRSLHGIVGLVGQGLFALLPVVQLATPRL